MKKNMAVPNQILVGLLALCCHLGMLALPLPALAEDTPVADSGVLIELNKLEKATDSCRAYLLFENHSGTSFDSLKLDLVMFDQEGVVAKRLAVEGAPLPDAKTSLKVFEISQLPCERIGRVLLNKLTSCDDAQGPRNDCLAMVSTRARGSVPFIK